MVDDHVTDRPADSEAVGSREAPLQVDKAVVKEALLNLLSEIPAFRALMGLPGPSSESGAKARQDAGSTSTQSDLPPPQNGGKSACGIGGGLVPSPWGTKPPWDDGVYGPSA